MANHLVDDEIYKARMMEYFEFQEKAFKLWRAVKGTPLQEDAIAICDYFHRRFYEIAHMLVGDAQPYPPRNAMDRDEISESDTTEFEHVELCIYEGLCQECGRELDHPAAHCSCQCHELG